MSRFTRIQRRSRYLHSSPTLSAAHPFVGRMRRVGFRFRGLAESDVSGGVASATRMGDSAFKGSTLPTIFLLIKRTSTHTLGGKDIVDLCRFVRIGTGSRAGLAGDF